MSGTRDRYVGVLIDKLAAMPGYDRELCDRIERALGSPMVAPAALAPRRVQIRRVIEVVASRYGVDPAALTGPARTQPEVTARHLAMRISRELTGETFEAIGAAFGGRNHGTVMYACEQTASMAVGDIVEELVG